MVKVSETNDEGSYARTTDSEATVRAGKGLQQGRLGHSHTTCLSRQWQHPAACKEAILLR